MYALDMQQKMLEPLSPMTQSSLLSFAELFSYMMSEGRNGRNNTNNPNVNANGGGINARAIALAANRPASPGPSSSPPSASARPVANVNNRAPVNFCDIMTVFEKAVAEVRLGQVPDLDFFYCVNQGFWQA